MCLKAHPFVYERCHLFALLFLLKLPLPVPLAVRHLLFDCPTEGSIFGFGTGPALLPCEARLAFMTIRLLGPSFTIY
jgi:hypothetical protein